MNIGPKTKQRIYLYIEKEHGWLSIHIMKTIVLGLLGLMRMPRSLKDIVQKEISSGDFKTPIRRLNWLFSYTNFHYQLFSDEFFDFSLGLNNRAALDMLNLHGSYAETKEFRDYVHIAQLASRVVESQLSPGESIALKDADLTLEYDIQYKKNLELALGEIKLDEASESGTKLEPGKETDTRTLVKSNQAFEKNTLAEDVFFDVVNFMDKFQPCVFSVSGTLLGIIRENKLLSHDIDIDLGIMEEDIDVEKLLKAIKESDRFYIKKIDYPVLRTRNEKNITYSRMSIPSLIKFGHKRGLHIDLFVHFKDKDIRWHGSSLHRWNNSDFGIEAISFMGQEINIPSEPERYLEENYGEWKIPKVDFSCSIDTPNIALQNSCKTVCYFIKLLHFYRSDPVVSARILSLLMAQDVKIPPHLH